ncbi:hypothetical protein FNF31_01354 [Cafeteria roenbergensis]|uniref:THH1/TOM1/TOM3 domain-containing protein n=2 Tax=Cafeteria roenbergensis TaxID=33653 RepID=A0A5A8DMD9_CAFRO|nr:hypothetical protein FNF31_01354 [Cafeteria roenbergensis]
MLKVFPANNRTHPISVSSLRLRNGFTQDFVVANASFAGPLDVVLYYERSIPGRADWRASSTVSILADSPANRVQTLPRIDLSQVAGASILSTKPSSRSSGQHGHIQGAYGTMRGPGCKLHVVVRFVSSTPGWTGCVGASRLFGIRVRRGPSKCSPVVRNVSFVINEGTEVTVDLGGPEVFEVWGGGAPEHTVELLREDGSGGFVASASTVVTSDCVQPDRGRSPELVKLAEVDGKPVLAQLYDKPTGMGGAIEQVFGGRRMSANSGLVGINALTLMQAPLSAGDIVVRVAYNDMSGADIQPLLVSSAAALAGSSAHQLLVLPRGAEAWVVFRNGTAGITTNRPAVISLARFDPERDSLDGVRDGWRTVKSVEFSSGLNPEQDYVQWYEAATPLDVALRPNGGDEDVFPMPNARFTGQNGRLSSVSGTSRMCDGSAVLQVQYCESAISAPRGARTFAIEEVGSNTKRSVRLQNCHETLVLFPASLRPGQPLSFQLHVSDSKGGFTARGKPTQVSAATSEMCPLEILEQYTLIKANLPTGEGAAGSPSAASSQPEDVTILGVHLQAGATARVSGALRQLAAVSEAQCRSGNVTCGGWVAPQLAAALADRRLEAGPGDTQLAAASDEVHAMAVASIFQTVINALPGIPDEAHVSLAVVGQALTASSASGTPSTSNVSSPALASRVDAQFAHEHPPPARRHLLAIPTGIGSTVDPGSAVQDTAVFDIEAAGASQVQEEDELDMEVQVFPARSKAQVETAIAAAVAGGQLERYAKDAGIEVTALLMSKSATLASSISGTGGKETKSMSPAMAETGSLVAAGICCALYAIILAYVVVQSVLLHREGHKFWSYKHGFSFLTILWTALRVGFWVDVLVAPDAVWGFARFCAFWAPHAVQFATFALLAVFFVQTINHSGWSPSSDGSSGGMRRAVTIAVVVATAVQAVFVFAAAGFASVSEANAATWGKAEASLSAIVFAGLSVGFLLLGYQLHKLPATAHNRMMLMHPRTTACVNIVLFLVFLSRSVFNLVTVSGAFSIEINSSSAFNDVAIVLVYTTWEVAPVVMLLGTVAGGGVHETAEGADPPLGLMLAIRDPDQGLLAGAQDPFEEVAVRVGSGETSSGTRWMRSPGSEASRDSGSRLGGAAVDGGSGGLNRSALDLMGVSREGYAGARPARGARASTRDDGGVAIPRPPNAGRGQSSPFDGVGLHPSFASAQQSGGESVGTDSSRGRGAARPDGANWGGGETYDSAYAAYAGGIGQFDGMYGADGDRSLADDASPQLLGEGPGLLSVAAATGQEAWAPESFT